MANWLELIEAKEDQIQLASENQTSIEVEIINGDNDVLK